MRHGFVIVQVKINNRERVVSQQGDGIANHAVETGGILLGIDNAVITPKGVGPNCMPVPPQFPSEPRISMRRAVAGHLATKNLDRMKNNGIEPGSLGVVDIAGLHG